MMVQILSSDVLSEIRMTVDEYLEADLPEGLRYELVGGAVQTSPIPEVPHDITVARLSELFILYELTHTEIIGHISQRSAVVLPAEGTVREPDFALYTPEQAPGRFGNWNQPRPTLIVEVVSPGQAERDYEEKRRDYWAAGVDEYWIADSERGALTVLRRGEDDWTETVFERAGVYRPDRFPELEIAVGELLAKS